MFEYSFFTYSLQMIKLRNSYLISAPFLHQSIKTTFNYFDTSECRQLCPRGKLFLYPTETMHYSGDTKEPICYFRPLCQILSLSVQLFWRD